MIVLGLGSVAHFQFPILFYVVKKKNKKQCFALITLTIFYVDPTGGIQEFLTTQHGTSISIIGMPFT